MILIKWKPNCDYLYQFVDSNGYSKLENSIVYCNQHFPNHVLNVFDKQNIISETCNPSNV